MYLIMRMVNVDIACSPIYHKLNSENFASKWLMSLNILFYVDLIRVCSFSIEFSLK